MVKKIALFQNGIHMVNYIQENMYHKLTVSTPKKETIHDNFDMSSKDSKYWMETYSHGRGRFQVGVCKHG